MLVVNQQLIAIDVYCMDGGMFRVLYVTINDLCTSCMV